MSSSQPNTPSKAPPANSRALSGLSFTLQPVTPTTARERDNPRAVRRVGVHGDVLKATRTNAGEVVVLREKGKPGSQEEWVVGVAWPAQGVEAGVCTLHPSMLATTSLAPGASVTIAPLAASSIRTRQAGTVHLSSPAPFTSTGSSSTLEDRDLKLLTALLKETLSDIKYLRPQQPVPLTFRGEQRTLRVERIESPQGETGLEGAMDGLSVGDAGEVWVIGWATKVQLDQGKAGKKVKEDKILAGPTPSDPTVTPSSSTSSDSAPLSAPTFPSIGGLDAQISEIRTLLQIPLQHPELFTRFNLKPPRGILLHGPPGTGKTLLAQALATSLGLPSIVVNGPELSSAYHGETEQRLRAVFSEARAKPEGGCVIVLDEVDALCPTREGGDGGEVEKRVVATLLTELDGVEREGEGRVFVVAATNRPNAIDPALRRPGRFDREIEIGVPTPEGRLDILRALLFHMPCSLSSSDLPQIAQKTHGFVGADLASLVRAAATTSITRALQLSPTAPQPALTLADLLAALPSIRPSALRSVALSVPKTRWDDVAGQESVKCALRECVEWPLRKPETFARLGARPPRGVLLYGPPGCSKTLVAKALAGEGGVNFLAVKGPELFNKYVGESERAVREIFAKARAAAPSILFFDEIDSLTSARGSDGGGGGSDRVVASLLNEMDGIEELVGVTVLAATNRPEIIDPALMRPGRLDRILYVGPPDLEARRELFRLRMKGMAVEEGMDVAELALETNGCSGAEIVSICQDAAMRAMHEDLDAPFVKREHFMAAAKAVRRRITPEMVRSYEAWRDQSGVVSA